MFTHISKPIFFLYLILIINGAGQCDIPHTYPKKQESLADDYATPKQHAAIPSKEHVVDKTMTDDPKKNKTYEHVEHVVDKTMTDDPEKNKTYEHVEHVVDKTTTDDNINQEIKALDEKYTNLLNGFLQLEGPKEIAMLKKQLLVIEKKVVCYQHESRYTPLQKKNQQTEEAWNKHKNEYKTLVQEAKDAWQEWEKYQNEYRTQWNAFLEEIKKMPGSGLCNTFQIPDSCKSKLWIAQAIGYTMNLAIEAIIDIGNYATHIQVLDHIQQIFQQASTALEVVKSIANDTIPLKEGIMRVNTINEETRKMFNAQLALKGKFLERVLKTEGSFKVYSVY